MTRRDFHRLSLAAGAACLTDPDLSRLEFPDQEYLQQVRKIPKTDTHMHLFNRELLSYSWLANAPEINRDFLPEDFLAATRKANVTRIVFMESGADAGSSMKEVNWVITQATQDPRIKGIVASGKILTEGGIDPPVEELLASGWVKGIRGGTPAELLASTAFIRSMDLLAKHGLSFDLLVRPPLFGDVAKAIDKAPDTTFILDHLGNPDIKGGDFEDWKKGIDELAQRPHLNCKISGIITRAGAGWTPEMLRPYVHHAIDRFGFDRIVYGGDWPVVLRAGSYLSWSRAFEELTRQFSREELHKLYHLNADRIYQLGD